MSWRADSRHLQDMRRADRPRRKDHFAAGVYDMLASAPDVFHANGSAAVEQDAKNMGFCYQRCIAAP